MKQKLHTEVNDYADGPIYETEKELMFFDKSHSFHHLKKCYILFQKQDPRFSYEPTEVLIDVESYLLLKDYVEETGTRLLDCSVICDVDGTQFSDYDFYFFFSIKDFCTEMAKASLHPDNLF